MRCSLGGVLLMSVVLRACLFLYGLVQDAHSEVKYTDIDYRVFTDAARYMSNRRSPYLRETYRYTPFLAFLMLPNVLWTEHFGKILFCCFDILTALVMYAHLRDVYRLGKSDSAQWVCLWLFNPLTLAISTRGSAESIMSFLLSTLLYFLAIDQIFLAGVVYAFSIIFKIYPIIYALPIYLFLQKSHERDHLFVRLFIPTFKSLTFAFPAAVILFRLVLLTYQLYGVQALNETYFYHLYRKDTKHNFSVFFYMFYLTDSLHPDWWIQEFVNYIPLMLQFLAVTAICFKFYNYLPFCFFLSTYAFVNLNKVCTSQYFVWYLTYLPLIAPHLSMSVYTAVSLAVIWIAGQLLWLFPAYLLEFRGINTFELIWAASLIFFLINNYILRTLVICFQSSFKQRELDAERREDNKVK